MAKVQGMKQRAKAEINKLNAEILKTEKLKFTKQKAESSQVKKLKS